MWKSSQNLQKWEGRNGRSQARTGLTVHPGDCIAIDESGTYGKLMAVTTGKLLMAVLATIFFKMRTARFLKDLEANDESQKFLREVYTKPESPMGVRIKKKMWSSTNQHFQ